MRRGGEVIYSCGKNTGNKGVLDMEKILLAIVGTVLITIGEVIKDERNDKNDK